MICTCNDCPREPSSKKLTMDSTLGTYVPEWLVAPSAMKELDKYVHTLYKLAQPQKRPSKPGDEEILMDSLAARQMEFKVRTTVESHSGSNMPDGRDAGLQSSSDCHHAWWEGNDSFPHVCQRVF